MGNAPIAGYHKHTFPSGDIYFGNFEASQRSGEGVMTYYNGDRYEGMWRLDKRHGPGKMEYHASSDNPNAIDTSVDVLPQYVPNDPQSFRYRAYKRTQLYLKQQEQQANVFLGTYDGYWLLDKRNAYGRFTYSNNDVYYGEFSNDARQGLGLLVRVGGDEYVGQYKANAITGWGVTRLGQLKDDVANIKEGIEKRVIILESTVMGNLFKQLKVTPPKKYADLTKECDLYKDYVLLFHRPSVDVQQTQIVSQLLDYAITTEMVKQQKLMKMEQNHDITTKIPLITHSIEIEAYWQSNQISGPNFTPTNNDSHPLFGDKAKSPNATTTEPKPNTNGFAIFRQYTMVQPDMDVAKFLDRNPSNHTTSAVTQYYTVIVQFGIEYLCEIRIVPITVARRVVEIAATNPENLNIDSIMEQAQAEMDVNDDEFDDAGNDDLQGEDVSYPIDALLDRDDDNDGVATLTATTPINNNIQSEQKTTPEQQQQQVPMYEENNYDLPYTSNTEECYAMATEEVSPYEQPTQYQEEDQYGTSLATNNNNNTQESTNVFQSSQAAQDAINRANLFDLDDEFDDALYGITDE